MADFDNISLTTRRNLASSLAERVAQRGRQERFIMQKRTEDSIRAHLGDIIEQGLVTALFQPVIDLTNGAIVGYEGLIRGPSDSPLHSPVNLFGAAEKNGLGVDIEHLSRRVVLQRFAELGLPGKLFLNVNVQSLHQRDARLNATRAYMDEAGIGPDRIIVELAESQPGFDLDLLYRSAMHYRDMGLPIAMDGFAGEFSCQRLCAQLRPEFVKIDFHLIQDISNDPVKRQFVRSIQEIAEETGCRVIAEGIETHRDLILIRDLGVTLGQGYHIARPNAHPAAALSAEVARTLKRTPAVPSRETVGTVKVTAAKLLREVPAVTPDTPTKTVYEMFNDEPELYAIPVVKKSGVPVGMVNRQTLIERLARPYRHELFGKKPCSKLMDPAPLIVDQSISLQELSTLIVEGERHHLTNGYIITEDGYYRGIGTGHDLVREITEMQIAAARYANPLTQLPGNIPIDEHIDKLLRGGVPFHICYCDLDHFKPFNDVYGFHMGDEVIRLTGEILTEYCDPVQDFVGHVGGDDFIVLFRSEDWEMRCERILKAFGARILEFFSIEDRDRGGYVTEDRQGKKSFQPLTSMSLGVCGITPDAFTSVHQVSSVASETKKQAKKIPGNSLFVERREHLPGAEGLHSVAAAGGTY